MHYYYSLPVIVEKTQEGKFSIIWDESQSPIAKFKECNEYMEIVYIGYPGYDESINIILLVFIHFIISLFVAREEQDDLEEALEAFNCFPVFLDRDLHSRFFTDFCKVILWPLFHYLMPANREEFAFKWDSMWQAYTTANIMYSKKVIHISYILYD
jgi:trehalose-6-phosphate synthase